MKNLKRVRIVIAIQISIVLIFLSACNKQKEAQEKITVACEGTRHYFFENEKRKDEDKTKRSTSYVFVRDSKSGEWTFSEAGGSNVFFINYEYLDQPGKPKASTYIYVDEQIIKFQYYFWQGLDEKQHESRTTNWNLSMNRITGEWNERRNDDVVRTDGGKSTEVTTTAGKCQNASQKF